MCVIGARRFYLPLPFREGGWGGRFFSSSTLMSNPEFDRLNNIENLPACRRWGPYVSDRQWSTVREDYSGTGDPWAYFPFWHAHKRAYRWGEDGLAGVSDDMQYLCLALALWNGQDPI